MVWSVPWGLWHGVAVHYLSFIRHLLDITFHCTTLVHYPLISPYTTSPSPPPTQAHSQQSPPTPHQPSTSPPSWPLLHWQGVSAPLRVPESASLLVHASRPVVLVERQDMILEGTKDLQLTNRSHSPLATPRLHTRPPWPPITTPPLALVCCFRREARVTYLFGL